MTETQRRIRAYKRALPHMKERVIAVALLLAMSISMMSSATFAWITLSTNPEVSSLATTIVANGNLEIALSNTDGEEPEESAVGDGGQNVALSNLTWGNLINLSDESYSLDQLVLRPAKLDTKNLIDSPINAVDYGADGRVTKYATSFAYTSYDAAAGKYIVPVKTDEESGETVNVTKYGVRAVSSVTYEDVEGKQHLAAQLDLIDSYFTEAQGLFQSIYQSNMYMPTVAYLVGVHVGYVLGDEDVIVDPVQVRKLKSIADIFYESMYNAGCMIVEMINLYELMEVEDLDDYDPYEFDDVFNVNNINTTLLNAYKAKIPAIDLYRDTWIKTVNFYNKVQEASNKSQVYWAVDLMNHVNLLCDMNSAKLNGLTADQMAADMTNQAASIIMADASSHVAVLEGGALVDADQLLDGDFYVASGRINISVVVPESIKEKVQDKVGDWAGGVVPDVLVLKPSISTSAEPPALLITDYQTASETASGGTKLKGIATAADTYAMAIDFWVRTNVADSLLILEGEIQADGSYGGVNRVWTELDDPNTDEGAFIHQSGGVSTTQGSGSCYVFYADSPEQQNQGLNLLRHMRVAFVSQAGDLLATANMNVDSAVKESGRVIVPLQLGEQTAIELEDGTTITRYIQEMPQNEPQRITAIIYLDGSELYNSAVMDSGTIKGQLNIQFGTTEMNMEPQRDEELIQSAYVISFAENTYDLGTYDPNNASIELKMQLTGTQPNTVKGNFLSIINQSQGARQEEFTMELGEDGYWTANVPFTGPGNYELRSIKLDGVDVALTGDQIVYVKIGGVAINSLSCDLWPQGENTYTEMTTDTYYSQKIRLNVASQEQLTIRGVFLGDNGQNISVNFSRIDGGTYEGTATFNSSGNYELTYLIIDGVETPLPEELYKTLSLKLGLKAFITIGTPVIADGTEDEEILDEVSYDSRTGWSFVYSCEKPLTMPVTVLIMDDLDHMMTDWERLELRYAMSDTNYFDVDVERNTATSSYTGDIVNFATNGYYQFASVRLDAENTIEVAASAPTITSISPAVMEYQEQREYPDLTYEWDAARELKIMLKNADVAQMDVQLTDGKGNNRVVKWSSNTIGRKTATINDESITTFTVPVPSDGQWSITDAWVSMVFYNGKFYSGAEIYDSDGVTVTGTDSLSLKQFVEDDDIGTYFLTELEIKTVGQAPEAEYRAEFMTSHQVPNMAVSVNNQGRPLAEVLEEVKELFPDEEINTDVQVGLVYDWDEGITLSEYGCISYSGTLPANTFGSNDLDYDSGTKTYPVGAMDFKMAGRYEVDFTLVIGGEAYTGSKIPSNLRDVEVYWTQPEVKITAVTGATKDSKTNTKFAINLASDSDYAGTNQENRSMNGVQNYFEDHYANVYIMGELGNYSVPQVKMKLTKAGESGSATFTISGGKSVKYSFTGNSAEDTHDIGETDSTDLWVMVTYSRTPYGTMKGSSVNLTYNGTTYTVAVPEVTVKQDAKPIYLQYTSTNAAMAIPSATVSPDGRAYTFTVSSVRPWTMEQASYEIDGGTPKVTTETVFEETSVDSYLGIYNVYHYNKYTRTTTVTEGITTTSVVEVGYAADFWNINGSEYGAGSGSFTITGQHTAEAIVKETGRNTVSVTTKKQRTTVIVDTYVGTSKKNGKPESNVKQIFYTEDLYPGGYSYTEDLS